MMDDSINRLSAILRACSHIKDDDVAAAVRGTLMDMPSAEKTGKWIYDKYYAVHVCSECEEQALEEFTVNPHTLNRDYDEVLSEYCPHCGAKMEVEEEEDDEEDDG